MVEGLKEDQLEVSVLRRRMSHRS